MRDLALSEGILYSAAWDNNVIAWDARTGQELARYPHPDGALLGETTCPRYCKNCPSLAPGLACASAMPFRRGFPTTTRILNFQANKCMFLATIVFLVWPSRLIVRGLSSCKEQNRNRRRNPLNPNNVTSTTSSGRTTPFTHTDPVQCLS